MTPFPTGDWSAWTDPDSTRGDRPIALVSVGDPDQTTGGSIYNRRMLSALRASGQSTVEIVLPPWPSPLSTLVLRLALGRVQPSIVVVDSIALTSAVGFLDWTRRRLNPRLVALMHTLPSVLAPAWQRPIARFAECRLVRSADRVIAVSPDLRDRLIAAGAAPERTVVILPGRDGLPVAPRVTASDDGGCRLLCVANWTPVKGIDVLVEAMARISDTTCLELVGEERDLAYARQVRALIRRHRLGGRVRIRGSLHGEALARCLAAADVFVLPSRFEGFGIVCAEAMSAGLPVVATRAGSLPWLIRDGGILVPPDDASALADGLTRLSADAALRRRLSQAALKRARELPTWRESSQAFALLLGALLCPHRVDRLNRDRHEESDWRGFLPTSLNRCLGYPATNELAPGDGPDDQEGLGAGHDRIG